MNTRTASMTRALLMLWALFTALPALALDEAPGQDHPLVSRFADSRLIGYRQTNWEQALVPTTAALKHGRWSEVQPVEGRLTRLLYTAPRGKSRLEVHRNYEQALLAAGLTKRASCEQRCEQVRVSLDSVLGYRSGMQFARDAIPHPVSGTFMITSAFSDEEARWFYGTLQRGGAEWHVLVATSQTVNTSMDMATTFIQIVEPKPMQTGQVTVDAKAIGQGLQSEGKIALYGLLFDTGKSALKPESQGQLTEMVALMKSQPALKVYIVGHTDNVGALDANRALSLARAQAVVAALQQAGIAADRLSAQAAASIAPVASNSSDAGRAKNRRVELVAQ
jgi:OmpA-OmpF porin, OOP family